jgi:hypothetical protein
VIVGRTVPAARRTRRARQTADRAHREKGN